MKKSISSKLLLSGGQKVVSGGKLTNFGNILFKFVQKYYKKYKLQISKETFINSSKYMYILITDFSKEKLSGHVGILYNARNGKFFNAVTILNDSDTPNEKIAHNILLKRLAKQICVEIFTYKPNRIIIDSPATKAIKQLFKEAKIANKKI